MCEPFGGRFPVFSHFSLSQRVGQNITENFVALQIFPYSQSLGPGQPRKPAAQFLPGQTQRLLSGEMQDLAQDPALVFRQKSDFNHLFRTLVKSDAEP